MWGRCKRQGERLPRPDKTNLEYAAIIIKNIKYLTDSENYAIISKIYSWPSQIRSLK
jgi:hypothetical protein